MRIAMALLSSFRLFEYSISMDATSESQRSNLRQRTRTLASDQIDNAGRLLARRPRPFQVNTLIIQPRIGFHPLEVGGLERIVCVVVPERSSANRLPSVYLLHSGHTSPVSCLGSESPKLDTEMLRPKLLFSSSSFLSSGFLDPDGPADGNGASRGWEVDSGSSVVSAKTLLSPCSSCFLRLMAIFHVRSRPNRPGELPPRPGELVSR